MSLTSISAETPTANHVNRRKRPADHKQPSPVVVQFQSAPVSISGPRAPRRLQWIPLAADGDYAGHQVYARIRYPDTLNVKFSSGDFEQIKSALREVVLEHNGWIDPDTEEPLPAASEDGFWASLAQEEVLLMLRAVGAARKKVLTGLLETNDN